MSDGTLAFARLKNPYGAQIGVVNPDGTDMRMLTHRLDTCCGDRYPDWSPDGTEIAFERHSRIYVMDADGQNVHAVTSGEKYRGHHFFDDSPSWSPDGQRIVFARLDQTLNRANLMTVAADGSDLRQVAATPDMAEKYPEWSPDGSRIAFFTQGGFDTAGGQRTPAGIYTVAPDGSGLRLVVAGSPTVFAMDWSPDGRRLVLVRSFNGHGRKLLTVPVSGGDPRPVPGTQSGASGPAWAPAGDRIAYAVHGDLFVVPADGGTPQKILARPSKDLIADVTWQPLP